MPKLFVMTAFESSSSTTLLPPQEILGVRRTTRGSSANAPSLGLGWSMYGPGDFGSELLSAPAGDRSPVLASAGIATCDSILELGGTGGELASWLAARGHRGPFGATSSIERLRDLRRRFPAVTFLAEDLREPSPEFFPGLDWLVIRPGFGGLKDATPLAWDGLLRRWLPVVTRGIILDWPLLSPDLDHFLEPESRLEQLLSVAQLHTPRIAVRQDGRPPLLTMVVAP